MMGSSGKIKVAVLGTLPPIKALSSYCLEFAKSLSDLCEVAFISFKKIYPSFLYPGGAPQDDNTYPEIASADLKIRRRLTWYNPLSWIFEGLFTKGDLLHVQWWSLPLFPIFLVVCACFKLRGKPVVITVHNILPHEKSTVFIRISSMLFAFGDRFIVHSKSCRRQLVEHYGVSPEKISVVPHGKLDFFRKDDIDPQALRKEMGFAPTDKIILLFGAIRSYKGVDIALKAMPEIISRVPDARLLIAGQLWEDWTPYSALIERLGIGDHVSTHLNYIPSGEVHRYFEICDLALFPYRRFDSQSGAAAAAVSFGKPMIVADAGGLPELVPDSRFVAPPDDAPALARSVVRFFRDSEMRRSFALEKDRISAKLDWKSIARKTRNVYLDLVSGLTASVAKEVEGRNVS